MKEGSSDEPNAKRQRKGKEIMQQREQKSTTQQLKEKEKIAILKNIKEKLDGIQNVKNWLVEALADADRMLNSYEQITKREPSTELSLAIGGPPQINTLIYTRRNKDVKEAETANETALTLFSMSTMTDELNNKQNHPRNN